MSKETGLAVVPKPGKAELEIGTQVSDLVKQADRCVVKSDKDAGNATTLLSMIKQAYKRADEERRKLVDPLNAVVKSLNERFKIALTPLDGAETKVKRQLGDYMAEQRRRAEEAARKEREKAEKAEAEGRARAAANAEARAQVAEASAANAGMVRGSFGGSVSLKKRWTFTVEDLNQVPREWLVLDEVAVRRAITRADDPVREIRGIRIYQTDDVSAR